MISFIRVITISFIVSIFTSDSLARTLHAVVVPGNPSAETADITTRTTLELMLFAQENDRVVLIDGLDQRLIVDSVIPRSRNDRQRLRTVAGDIKKLRVHMASAQEGDPEYTTDLPKSIDLIRSLVEDGEKVRIILIGSPFHGDGTDARHDFRAGRYPSDGHPQSHRRQSELGTQGLRPFNNARLDLFNLTPIEDSAHRYANQRFWQVYLAERGITLTSWNTDRPATILSLKRDITEPLLLEAIDRDDLRREIRRVGGGPVLMNTWTLVFAVDASASMDEAFASIREQVPVLADRLYASGAELRVAVIPFRTELLEPFPMTAIRSEVSDGGTSLTALISYLDSVQLKTSPVHPGIAFDAAVAMLRNDSGPETFERIILIGDAGPETNNVAADTAEVIAKSKAWVEGGSEREVWTVYLGDSNSSTFFSDLASAGNGNTTLSVRELADAVIREAASITTGNTP